MKRFVIAVLFSLFMLPLATTALAGGGAGPPKDMIKGVFTEMNAADRTVVIRKDGTNEMLTLTLGESM